MLLLGSGKVLFAVEVVVASVEVADLIRSQTAAHRKVVVTDKVVGLSALTGESLVVLLVGICFAVSVGVVIGAVALRAEREMVVSVVMAVLAVMVVFAVAEVDQQVVVDVALLAVEATYAVVASYVLINSGQEHQLYTVFHDVVIASYFYLLLPDHVEPSDRYASVNGASQGTVELHLVVALEIHLVV